MYTSLERHHIQKFGEIFLAVIKIIFVTIVMFLCRVRSHI